MVVRVTARKHNDIVLVHGSIVELERVVGEVGVFPIDSGWSVSDVVSTPQPDTLAILPLTVAEGHYPHALVV